MSNEIKEMLDNTILDWNSPNRLTSQDAKFNYNKLIPAITQIEKEARLDGLIMARYVTAKDSREEKAIDVLIKSQELKN